MFANSLQLAWHFWLQEKRLAHTRYLRWIQIILMAFIITLSQTSETIQQFLNKNLANLLGADLVLVHQTPLKTQQLDTLKTLSQRQILTQSLMVTLTHKNKWQSVKLKAVGNGYPLQGHLVTAASLQSEEVHTTSGPKTGEIWLDSRALASLEIGTGESLLIANKSFTVTKVLVHEPDRLMEGHSVDMRAMINLNDIEHSDIPKDLIQNRYLFSASASQIEQILKWQKEQLPSAQVYHKTGAHPLSLFWQRTENFLGLTSIILFFMAAIAIEKITKIQTTKEQYFSAICMSLGASRQTGLRVSFFKWLINLVPASVVALLCSAFCYWLIVNWLSSTFVDITSQWSLWTATKSIFVVSSIFFIFQTPVWVGLMKSSTMQLINSAFGSSSNAVTICSAMIVLTLVAFSYSDNALLTTMVVISMLSCIALIVLFSWTVLTVGEKMTKHVSGLLPFTLFMMKQRLVNKSTQILGVGLCSFLLLFTLMLMKDLGDTLASYEREHNGNLLVSQATQAQMKDIETWANEHGIEIRQQKPFLYANLLKINQKNLNEHTNEPSDSMATMRDSIRLHWTDTIPNNNKVNQGSWWNEQSQNWQLISVEEEVMTDLKLAIGDVLTFYIGEQTIDFTIAASHEYKAGAGSITFWVQMPARALEHIKAPHYNMASLELNDEQFSLLGELWQKHPSLRMVSLQEITARFDKTLAMLTQAISGFSILIIVLSFIVIFATINAVEGNERKKNSVIMSFGLTRNTCLKLNMIEWVVTGLVAASGAIAATYLAGVLIYQAQFSLPYQPDLTWLFGTLFIVVTTITSLGIAASNKTLSNSIRTLLQEQ
ncbi:ABC transporter permease [Pseudoalteromonas sp. T1lg65]|uniref:ABC transporter permease n=1 Tax=Pseudoalteromonas sp. T1lg65 TaxID=2077101 RepID=UPI003F7B2927